MKRGLFRFNDPILGDAACVHKSAGDAAPYLSRCLYERLALEPEFDCLPILPRIPKKVTAGGEALRPTAPSEENQQAWTRAGRPAAVEDGGSKRALP